MEEYRQTNPLELHVNREIQAELHRETLSHTLHAHLNAVYQYCAGECINHVKEMTIEEKKCLSICYGKMNDAHQRHINSLIHDI